MTWTARKIVELLKSQGPPPEPQPTPEEEAAFYGRVRAQMIAQGIMTEAQVDEQIAIFKGQREAEGDLTPSQRLFRDVWNQVDEACRNAGRGLEGRPLLELLNSGVVNGMAVRGQDGEQAVLLEDSLFGFCNLLFKSLTPSLLIYDEDRRLSGLTTDADVVGRTFHDPAVAKRMAELFYCYIMTPSVDQAEQYTPPRDVAHVAMWMTQAVELFIVGHEYGHLRLGHLDTQMTAFAFDGGELEVDAMSRSLQQEFEADAFGLEAVLLVVNNDYQRALVSMFGIGIFFAALSTVLDSILFFYEPPGEPLTRHREVTAFAQRGGSHPPGVYRVESLRRVIANLNLPPEISQSFQDMLTNSQLVWEAVSRLIVSYMTMLKEQGLQPDPRWSGYRGA